MLGMTSGWEDDDWIVILSEFPFKNYMWYFFCIDIDCNNVRFEGSASSRGKPGLTDDWNHKNSQWPLHFYNAIMCMYFLQLLDYTVNTVVKSVCQMNSCTYFWPSSKRDRVDYPPPPPPPAAQHHLLFIWFVSIRIRLVKKFPSHSYCGISLSSILNRNGEQKPPWVWTSQSVDS